MVADAAYSAVRVQIWSRLAGGGTLLSGAAGQLGNEVQVLLGDQIWLTEVTYQLAVKKKTLGKSEGPDFACAPVALMERFCRFNKDVLMSFTALSM